MNGYFLPILLNKKIEKDKHSFSMNKKAKIERVFFEDVFLISLLYWSSLCFLKINVDICKKDHIRKDGGENPSLSTGTANRDRKRDDQGISTNIIVTDRRTIRKIFSVDQGTPSGSDLSIL